MNNIIRNAKLKNLKENQDINRKWMKNSERFQLNTFLIVLADWLFQPVVDLIDVNSQIGIFLRA